MVSVYTIDGEVTLDTAPFDESIGKMISKMEELMTIGRGNWNFNGAYLGLTTLRKEIDKVKSDITTMSSEFANTKGINSLKAEVQSLRKEMDMLKTKIKEVGTTASNEVTQVKNNLNSHSDYIAIINSEIGQVNAKWRETQLEVSRTNQLMKQIYNETNGWTTELSRVELANKQIELYFRREQSIMKNNLSILEEENAVLEQQRALEESKLVAEENLNKAISSRVSYYTEMMAQQEKEMEMAYRIATVQEEMNGLIGVEAEEIIKVADSEKEVLSLIQRQVATEEERLGLIADINAMNTAQITKVPTSSTTTSTGSKVNKLDQMGNMPRRIGSMVIAMWGFNEAMDIYKKTMEDINAKSELEYFGKRLNMTDKEMKNFNETLEQLQQGYKKTNGELVKGYQKVDMKMVGASALDTARKYKVQKDNVDELTEVMAIYGSEFVRQGRTQEDSILAVNDALDGELRRLKEVGIGQKELKEHGWKGEGDTEGMIKALKEIADERGYTETAKDITNLSDAITSAELELSFLLSDLFELAEPSLIYALKQLIKLFGWLGTGVKALKGYLQGLPQPLKNFLKMFGGNALLGLGGLFIGKKIVGFLSGFKLLGGAWSKLMEKLGRTKGIDKATESFGKFEKTTTGGTAGNGENVGFKEGFKKGIQGLGQNLGSMAKVFVELAVAIGMAFALMEEALLLISGVGATYDALKPQFDSGIKFIQEFGIWIWGASAVLIAFMGILGKFGKGLDTTMISGGKTIAKGLATAIGLVALAIVMLLAPLGAIALLGAFQGWQQGNIEKGMEVIHMFADALNYIANNKDIATFLLAFSAISIVLGVSEGILTEPLVVGVATAIGLVAVAIGMLIVPLGAIALLGVTYSTLGQENVQKGAEVIRIVGDCLKALEPAVKKLLDVDVEMFGAALVDLATKLVTGGKDGITALSEDIVPKFVNFAKKINEMEMPTSISAEKITALTTIATQIPPLFKSLESVNNALGTSDGAGNIGGALGGGISNLLGMGLSGKLDQMYNDAKDIMDFATKMKSIGGKGADTSAVQQVAKAIVDLKAKLTLMSNTISLSVESIHSSSTQLGKAIITGWKKGSASFGATVVQTVANGVKAVQNRYDTMASGGKTLGNKLSQGFNSHSPKLVTLVSNEIYYALKKLDNNEQNFYDRGAKLGKALADGFESEKGLVVGSPARIARAIAQEMVYSKNALDMGVQMMYNSGASLGRALADGYDSNSTLKTNIGMLASKGLSDEELTQGQIHKQQNKPQQTPNATIININMNGANIYGVKDLENTMRNIADRVFIEYNDVNPNIGG